jgi:hypothetical protein
MNLSNYIIYVLLSKLPEVAFMLNYVVVFPKQDVYSESAQGTIPTVHVHECFSVGTSPSLKSYQVEELFTSNYSG